ncbi:SPOSA6832_05044 [Sporobolomyces salmonicolor]|uniref:SPOSA6832_05044-mRNA-1:cds n=1 Tax=Sporidiobolus salmonicolor TaxID=5005 RepID=A0A0D6EU83_SPOSA|nr:SPOSA6832_05044 [Sporobolomyces salmonicolor]
MNTNPFRHQSALFHPETPSRVLRRIEDLNQQSLPELPGLPSEELTSFSEDGDSTVAHSPAQRKPASPLLSHTRANSPASHQLPPPTPYTSTPASSTLYQRSQSTIIPSTSSTRHSANDTTATIGPTRRLQEDRPAGMRRGGRTTPTQGDSFEEGPSFEDNMSEIVKARSLEEEREDMLVLSGSGGENSDRDAADRRVTELSALPSAQLEMQETTEDTSNDPSTGDEDSSMPRQHPLDLLGPLEPVALSPVCSASSYMRLRSTEMLPSQFLTAKAPSPTQKQILPSTLSPLRERSVNTSSVASPELGRHSSPHPSLHSMQSFPSDMTPSRTSEKVPSTSLTPNSAATPRLDSPLSPVDLNADPSTPSFNQSAAQRRANHLLTTLRSTAKPRFVRGTPHPAQSARKASLSSPHTKDDDRSSSSFASDHSSNDLTTYYHKANASLPSGGSADVGGATTAGSRFNGAKLNAYLHSLNTHLTDENQQLVKTLKRTTKDVERWQNETRRLEDTIREMSVAGGISVNVSDARGWSRTRSIEAEADEENEGSRVETLGRELEGLVDGQRRIRGLQDQLGDQLGGMDAAARIRELEEDVERAERHLVEKDQEIARLRDQVVSNPNAGTGDDSERSALVQDLQQEVFDLKDALNAAANDRDVAQGDLAKLQADFTAAGEASEKDFATLQARIDELLLELQDKDAEVEGVKQQMVDQENEFAEKMEELEQELCRVMEEQEAKVEAARKELEAKQKEDDVARKQEKETLERVKAERDALERRLEKEGKDLDEEVERQVSSLKRDVEARDDELNRMQTELAAAEDRVSELEKAVSGVNALRHEIVQKDEEIQQLEGALDESANQLLQNEDDLAALRSQLASEKQINSSLSAQISQLSLTKAKSPLGNEAYNRSKDEVIASLEEELEEARKELVQLKEQLAANANENRSTELRDLEIKNLETSKADLEDRVKTLRQQVSMQFSPNKTPDKSWLLRPLPSVKTPKTPGQFLSHVNDIADCSGTSIADRLPPLQLSAWSPGTTGNETISPLLAQIHELEQVVERLQLQLADANAQIDNKLDRLEAAGSSTISLARQLSAAQARIAKLEEQLERLLGENGSLERVRARLAKIHCPDCQVSFDANKVVQLRVDRSDISFSDSSFQAPAGGSLRSTLASVNAKLDELRVENDVLKGQAATSEELAREKAKLMERNEALQRDLKHARDEITVLETDLRADRSRLRTLTNNQALANKGKTVLESRLAAAEVADLNRVRQDAVSLGLDLAAVRRERDEMAKQRAEGGEVVKVREELAAAKRRVELLEQQLSEHACSGTDPKTIADLQARHKQEAKGLLILVRQLKLRVNREVDFRQQAGLQKTYLSNVVQEKQATIDSIMSQLELPLPSVATSKVTFRSAALAISAISRLRFDFSFTHTTISRADDSNARSRLSREWEGLSVPKKRLREQAYPDVRGRAFPT